MDSPSQCGRGFGHHCILLPPLSRRVYITCHSTEETNHTVARCGTATFGCGIVLGISSHAQQDLRCYYRQIAQQYAAHTKNGTKGAVVHHSRGRGSICPVAALARRVANIQAGPARGNINLVYHTGGRISRVSDRDIGITVRWGATCDYIISKGYTLNRVSSHSLRAGGAMAMKLSGASDSTIMRVGRWSSLTYLTYIHSQIGALMAGVAWKMSTAFTFQNVG